ncbi:hypothetical protein [Phenylobacterium sp.]|uniref:hypothetical protein n=1 Tax=Phenylobacterium sp. TaxID=1871053 RepID=UPI001216816B|nr:hypothetical protein [Phenylobacterium sp.]THD60955.1 MAG: hypothetical protein E8A49_11820 [Phenylobacterium sp.]
MQAFDYLSVLLSIVLGLGITQLLSAFARWLELRREIKPYAPSALWAGFLLLVHVQTWWAMFALRGVRDWNFLEFTVVLLQPILLFLLASLALPGPQSTERDMRAHFFAHRLWFFWIFLAVLVVSLSKDLVIAGVLPTPLNLAFHGALFACGVTALSSRGPLVQLASATSALALMVLYIGVLFANLG